MNIYTKMIIEKYWVNETIALKIQALMEKSDLDFSECTKEMFYKYSDKAYNYIIWKFFD